MTNEERDNQIMHFVDLSAIQTTGRKLSRRVGFVGKTKDFDFWSQEEVDKYGYQIISLLEEE